LLGLPYRCTFAKNRDRLKLVSKSARELWGKFRG
jgi:hypothetical protein